MCNEAYARVVLNIFCMLGKCADKDEQAAVVVNQVWSDGAERVPVEFF